MNTLDNIIIALADNVIGPAGLLLSLVCYLLGAWLTASFILRLLKHAQQPHSARPMGTMMTLLAAAMLLSVADSMSAFTVTAFGDDTTVNTFSGLAYSSDAAGQASTQAT